MNGNRQENKKSHFDLFKGVIVGVAVLAVVFLIFGAGMIVGGMKAKFSYRWAENYHKNFAGPRGGFLGNWRSMPPLPGDFIESHGTFGEIIKIDENVIIIKGKDEIEKTALASPETVIHRGRKTIKIFDLKVNDRVVIIGSPNEEGQIEAKLIRAFDEETTKELPDRPLRPFPFF